MFCCFALLLLVLCAVFLLCFLFDSVFCCVFAHPVPRVVVNTTAYDRCVFPPELRGWISGRVIIISQNQKTRVTV